ncbi:hypothetical protein C7B65_10020 [Phormidesmis priestleyi ULC007]|uniref:Uncharacterized protein n=1 Tax=Phormidesmis priestleyi ULC007 TaxID=1920490 RepID=A0A2T1DHM9_9CYAN|nr:hypothetical protein [Phormidesmis priestleyi]PSB19983.1 hypothetical protein C7B65_10020 [Phormidesmis priestleyi ULC007]PZO50319.1 MAG: hypothetical protein DCF14_11590 [Phormidesmis priestleyi]
MKGSSRSEVKPTAVRQPRYGKEEFAQRCDALCESQVRSLRNNHHQILDLLKTRFVVQSVQFYYFYVR